MTRNPERDTERSQVVRARSPSLIRAQIQSKLRDQPSYRPKDIQKDLRCELGIQVSYIQAYRAKEEALAAINGTDEESYKTHPLSRGQSPILWSGDPHRKQRLLSQQYFFSSLEIGP